MTIEWVYPPMGVALTLAIMATVLTIRRLRITNLTGVVAIGMAAVAFLDLRLIQIWQG